MENKESNCQIDFTDLLRPEDAAMFVGNPETDVPPTMNSEGVVEALPWNPTTYKEHKNIIDATDWEKIQILLGADNAKKLK